MEIVFDKRRMTIRFVPPGDEENDEMTVLSLPGRFEVCPRCSGKGSYVNPAIDGHGITAEEWARDWDDESKAAYLDGRYDVACALCHGERVIMVPNRDTADLDVLKIYDDALDQERRWDAEDRAAYRMESGGFDS